MSADNKEQNKKRTELRDLPRPEEELSADEQKQVQGGATRAVTPGIRTQSSGAVADSDEPKI